MIDRHLGRPMTEIRSNELRISLNIPIHRGKYHSISCKTDSSYIMSSILVENIIKIFMITFKFPDYNRKSTGTDYLLLNLKMH